jgi:hypothetical protein
MGICSSIAALTRWTIFFLAPFLIGGCLLRALAFKRRITTRKPLSFAARGASG